MKFYIREWDDQTVTLMSETGYALAYFPSILEALSACEDWYFVNSSETKCDVKIVRSDSNMHELLQHAA